jgi:hypothetical protein
MNMVSAKHPIWDLSNSMLTTGLFWPVFLEIPTKRYQSVWDSSTSTNLIDWRPPGSSRAFNLVFRDILLDEYNLHVKVETPKAKYLKSALSKMYGHSC